MSSSSSNSSSSSSCKVNLTPVKEKKPNLLKKLVQTYNPKPIKGALVRYDSVIGKWAVCDDKLNPTQHFELGVMKNVEFSSSLKTTPARGCGSAKEVYIGIAKGDLYLHKQSTSHGGVNLGFSQGRFFDTQGMTITKADEIAFMPERHALLFK